MLKDRLLIGQYYAAESLVHRLNAKCKILVAILYMVSLLLVDNWWGWGIAALVCMIAIVLGRIPWRALWRGLKAICLIALLTFLLNALFQPGEHVLFRLGAYAVTRESVLLGLGVGLRLVLLVLFSSLLTLTTTPLQLTEGVEGLLSPFARFGLPAHEIAMVMTISLRFIPVIMEELERIILAQKARGAQLSQGSLLQRSKAIIPLLVPLFISAFRRAEELATAMEARCYHGSTGRSRWKRSPWQRLDSCCLALFIFFFLAAIALAIGS